MKNIILLSIALFALLFSTVDESYGQSRQSRLFTVSNIPLNGADTAINMSALKFNDDVNAIVIEVIYSSMASTENLTAVKLFNGVTSGFEGAGSLGNPLFVDSLEYVTADGADHYEFAKVTFFRSHLSILIDRVGTGTADAKVTINIYAIKPS